MKLVFENGTVARCGMVVETFKGDKVTLQSWSEPTHAGSTGRVYCYSDESSFVSEWFPSVIGAKFVED